MEPKAFYWYDPSNLKPIASATEATEEAIIDSLLTSGKIQLTEEGAKYQQHKKNKEKAEAANQRARTLFGDCKVIVNNPAVILKVGGKKYVSVAAEGEEFDAEKGLMLCMLKWHEMTFGDVDRLLKKAQVFKHE